MGTSRREFIWTTASLAGAAGLSSVAQGAPGAAPGHPAAANAPEPSGTPVTDLKPLETSKEGDMFYKKLGKTGEKVSILGVGGYHIGKPKDPAVGIAIIRKAIDAGVNFLDNCWDYNNGDSEVRMGNALKDGYRKKVFLMTKLDGRSKQAAADQIDESLKHLQTDVIDLMQIHEVLRLEDPDVCFRKGGCIEALQEAEKAGKIRYIGFTGHKDPLVHLRMLDTAAQHGFHFDTVQMPVNVMDAHFRSFTQNVLPRLVKEGIGALGMKPLCSGWVFKAGVVSAAECLHFAMTMPTSVVITGMESEKDLAQALEAVKTFKPLDQEALTTLLAKTKDAAESGDYELFKTGVMFDGTASHPQWLGYGAKPKP